MSMKTFVPLAVLLLSGPAFADAPAATSSSVTQSSVTPASPDATPSPTAPIVKTKDTPTGAGDPSTITCRAPQTLPGERLKGPEVCRTNAQWAQYRKDGMDVAADGVHFQPSEKMRTINPQACRPATMGGGGTAALIYENFSMVCE
jgi:hypothetical protein